MGRSFKFLSFCLLCSALLSCSGGGGTATSIGTSPSAPVTPPTPPPSVAPTLPQIALLSPSIIMVGVPVGLLTLDGSNFTQYSQILMDGAPVDTIFKSPTEIEAQISTTLDFTPGVHQLTVQDNGKTSNAATYTVYAPKVGPQLFAAQPGFFASPGYEFGVVVTDVNGDGIADVVVGGFDGGKLSYLRGNKDGTLSAPTTIDFTGGVLAAGDMNGDGFADLLAVDTATGKVAALLNDHLGNFKVASEFPVAGDFPIAEIADVRKTLLSKDLG